MAGVTFETRQGRTNINLPDIFRTSSGVNFDIGPTDRLRDAQYTNNKENIPWSKRGKEGESVENQSRFPRIILRDTLGRELDTFTTLQEAIYRAKWNIKQTGQSREPLEWRLPKAPPPARPDLTRTFPPVRPPQPVGEQQRQKFRNVPSHIMEFDVEDVGFVKESLQHLPYVPSLSFLRQEILVGPKTYFQIVGTMLLHKKILSQTEKRQAIYNFPGFCSGCLRSGLCYGCERSSQMHYHEDKLVKTGGGFTYFRKDRPGNEIKSNNPSNWKIHDTSKTLKKLMEEYAGVDLEGEIPDEVKRHLDQYGGQRVSNVAQIPDYARGFETYEKEQADKRKAETGNLHLSQSEEGIGGQEGDLETDLDLIASYNSQGHEDMRGQGETDAGDIDIEVEGETRYADREYGMGRSSEQPYLTVPTSSYTHVVKPELGDQHAIHVSYDGRRSPSDEEFEHRLPKYRRRESDDEGEQEGEGPFTGGGGIGRIGRRRERLYRPPPPFKPKKSPSRRIEAKSPFSTDRKFNLPTGKGFVIKKSDKSPTQFVDFKNADVTWKEPKKFELKKAESKTTKFWSGPPPSKKKEKKTERKSKSLSPPRKKIVDTSLRSQSPDSGVDSGFKTGRDRSITAQEKKLPKRMFQPRSSTISPIFYDFHNAGEMDDRSDDSDDMCIGNVEEVNKSDTKRATTFDLGSIPSSRGQGEGHSGTPSQRSERFPVHTRSDRDNKSGKDTLSLSSGTNILSLRKEKTLPPLKLSEFTACSNTENIYNDAEELCVRNEDTVSSSRESRLKNTIYQRSRTLEDFKSKLQAVLSNRQDSGDDDSESLPPLKVPTGRKESFQPWEWFAVNYETSDESDDEEAAQRDRKSRDEEKSQYGYEERLKGNDKLGRIVSRWTRKNEIFANRKAYLRHSPPLIPSDLDFDKVSLTSVEPDLELEFTDVIDVENMEVVDENTEEEEKKKKEEKRQRRHKRKHKRRKRNDRVRNENEDMISKVDSNMTENDLSIKTGDENPEDKPGSTGEELTQHKEEIFENTASTIETAPKSIENVEDNISNNEMFREDAANELKHKKMRTTRRYRYRSKSSDSLESVDQKLMELEDSGSVDSEDQFGYDFDSFSRTTRNTQRSRKKTRGRKDAKTRTTEIAHRSNTRDKSRKLKASKADYDLTLKRVYSHDCTTHEVEKTRRVNRHSHRMRTDESNEDIDFAALPSIQHQLAKILPSDHKKTDNDSTDVDNTEDEIDVEVLNDDKSGDNKEINFYRFNWNASRRPRSAEVEINDAKLRRQRSMSLPLMGDLEAMLEGFDFRKLKEPIQVPVYLPSFPRGRIIKKKEKCANPRRVKGRPARSMSVAVVSELLPMIIEDSTNKSELEPVREETPVREKTPPRPPTPVKPVKMEETVTPVHPPSPERPARREIVKKEKKPVEPRRPKPRTPTPPPPKSPSPVSEKEPSREISFVFDRDREPSVPQLPDLPPIEIPELPEIKTPEPQQREEKPKPQRMLIEVTPELKEGPKKLRPPPKLAPRIKPFVHMRRGKVAEAPVTTEELQDATDPLDFLAKYCIINPERLPYYERVFNSALSVQTPRYMRDLDTPPPGVRVRLPPAQLSSHEMHMLRDLTVLSRIQSVRKEGLTAPEQYLEKLNYSIEFIQKKQDAIADKMAKLQAEKTHYMAELAKSWKPDIARLGYRSKIKSKRKKKKPKLPDYDTFGAMSSPPKDFQPRTLDDITDEVIVSRMDDKMRKKVKKDPKVHQINLELKRDIERLKTFDERLNQIDDEKDLINLYCMDYYFSEQMASTRPTEFRRQQSVLYQKLNPEPDIDMNIEEVEAALQQINNHLITEKEFQYIYFILNLPRREKINFRLFCIIAALSEKVSQMDPFIRKLMTKVDYNALDVKMEKSKELFGLLQDGDALPAANALASDLSVELTAGGLTPEHTNYVLSKFNREGRGFVDFLDFVTYVPLFIEIHKRIIEDPFNDTLAI